MYEIANPLSSIQDNLDAKLWTALQILTMTRILKLPKELFYLLQYQQWKTNIASTTSDEATKQDC